MSLQLSPATRSRLLRIGRIALGVAVGASFGIAIGALVASWVWGVAAIEDEAASASYLAAGITLLGAAVGGAIGVRSGRSERVTDSDRAAPRR